MLTRWFLCGAGAAIAAASSSLPQFTPVQPVPAMLSFVRRAISEISLVTDGLVDHFRVEVGLSRGYGVVPLLTLQGGSDLLWRALPAGEIILTQDWALSLVANRGIGSIELYCRDQIEDGSEEIRLLERHTFPSRGPAQVFALDVKDADRLARYLAPTTDVRAELYAHPAVATP